MRFLNLFPELHGKLKSKHILRIFNTYTDMSTYLFCLKITLKETKRTEITKNNNIVVVLSANIYRCL